ncbi:MAG: nucleotidyltransferase domain-containing protein [Terracidiphilus sp.]|jgi:predicted nucleotidyltransferase
MATARKSEVPASAVAPILAVHQIELETLCRQFHVQRLELFGSALNGGFNPTGSDLDFLVEFDPLTPADYATAFFGFKEAVEQLFGQPVDLVVFSAIRNPYFRRNIEQSKALLYAA